MNAFLSSMTGSKPKKSALESAVAKLKEGKRLDELKQFKAAIQNQKCKQNSSKRPEILERMAEKREFAHWNWNTSVHG